MPRSIETIETKLCNKNLRSLTCNLVHLEHKFPGSTCMQISPHVLDTSYSWISDTKLMVPETVHCWLQSNMDSSMDRAIVFTLCLYLLSVAGIDTSAELFALACHKC